MLQDFSDENVSDDSFKRVVKSMTTIYKSGEIIDHVKHITFPYISVPLDEIENEFIDFK